MGMNFTAHTQVQGVIGEKKNPISEFMTEIVQAV